MTTYKVLSAVKHRGKIRAAGTTIDLDEETALPLIAAGAIEPPAAKQAASDEGSGKGKPKGDR